MEPTRHPFPVSSTARTIGEQKAKVNAFHCYGSGPVCECTFYEDRRLASKEDMEEIAWKLRSTTTKPNQSLGFVSAAQLQEIESESAEIASTNADELKPSG